MIGRSASSFMNYDTAIRAIASLSLSLSLSSAKVHAFLGTRTSGHS